MRPLTIDDLLPLTEYARRRREFFDSHTRYVDRYRRVRVGPRVTLLFQNRQTLWFHIQELVRVARLVEPHRIQDELGLYNGLLPAKDFLQAALLLDADAMTDNLDGWNDLSGDAVCLCVGELRVPAELLTCRPEDRCSGATHWVRFHVDSDARKQLADFRRPAICEVSHGPYYHVSPAFAEDARQSLLDDLSLSDKDP